MSAASTVRVLRPPSRADQAPLRASPAAGELASYEELRRLAFFDHQTGLLNRTAFAQLLGSALSRARAHGHAVALMFVDLDGFKLVNDTLGHHAGDALLERVAERLRGMRQAGCLLARQGGDEFLMLYEGLGEDPAGAVLRAQSVAGEIQRRIREPFTVAGCTFETTVSIGISVFPTDATDGDALIQHADRAMYRAKRAGRGGTAVFDPSEQRSPIELETTLRVRRALEQDQLELFYQPVVEIADGRGLGGLEALLRWHDPDRGLITPGAFLPAVADSPLEDEIGEWVFTEVCRQLARWRRSGFSPRVSFNIPARQLRRPGFAEHIRRTAAELGADLTRIAAEITETGAVDLAEVVPTLDALKEAGIVLSLDDFGKGYSSLSRLREMPFSLLKTDLSFMRGIPEDTSALELMQGIISLGQTLGMVVIVEGVETQAQLDSLLGIGCRVAQGYHLGRPVPAAQIEAAWACAGAWT